MILSFIHLPETAFPIKFLKSVVAATNSECSNTLKPLPHPAKMKYMHNAHSKVECCSRKNYIPGCLEVVPVLSEGGIERVLPDLTVVHVLFLFVKSSGGTLLPESSPEESSLPVYIGIDNSIHAH